jgi:large subunit ribosomal protein L23
MQDKIFNVIKRPVISEKSTALAEVANRYVFEVDSTATKPEIKTAVEQLFKVKVKAVNTLVMHGKNKRSGRFEFKRSNWKKAIITLAPGQKIELFQVKQ